MVRTAYTPTVDDPTPCVTAGAVTTVHVTYALIQTSGLVWTGLENGASASTLGGYDPVDVSATGNALAAVLANAHGSDGFTFDDLGNLWVTGGTTADPAVARYPAAMFANGGNLSPDFTLSMSLPAWGGGIPGAQVVTFDPQGNLWVSVDAANKVVKFDADQLVAGGSTVPSVEESGINAPQGVAFDTAGNMWVAASGDAKVMRINAVHLTATGSGADFEITAMRAGADVAARHRVRRRRQPVGELRRHDRRAAREHPRRHRDLRDDTARPAGDRRRRAARGDRLR
jgi:hypothetical protein